MLKTIALPLIAIMLIFSILAPSLTPLLGDDYDIAVLIDVNEEEKNKEKESEKKFDEKNLFLNSFASSDSMFFQNPIQSSNRYLFSNSDFKAEILLPPPRKLV
ncbi:hypothetical protein [Flagellimonas sp. CMM7]|uniref:hypothetical protein n=1 Tax=Flagellimonas sp. CMM7 TaxID=2654676 RepID=UPI0013D37A60|nr:hypothetical protein [Flagellimonas sp. CMM7]UII81770.1 hypothetical protein LV704_09700 [Flagellimonas sp. CMM7]